VRHAIRCIPLVLVAIMATAAFGQIVPGDPSTYPSVSVVNTPHNLNNYPGVTLPGNQVCLPCHTPHNALLPGEENVLWNHAETQETFTMYSSSAGQPEGASKMCLSCHDGVTAIDSYGGNIGSIVLTGDAALGTDLSDDHPIGIEYPSDPAGYNDPSTFDPGINYGPGVQLVEINGTERVECTSCHEPHNNGLSNFLRVPLQESYICLQCHIK
jgi:predicted CXXCH cytochrome family protein